MLSFYTENVITHIAEMFSSVADESACKVAWAVHVIKIGVTRLAISRPSWDPQPGVI